MHPIAKLVKNIIQYHNELCIDEENELDFNGIDYIDDYDDYLGNIDYVTDFRESFFLIYLSQQKYLY